MSLSPPELRSQIREEIAAITPFDSIEKGVIADALSWVDSGVELFRVEKPATPPKHLVSYFLLIDGDDFLLVDHIKSGLWLPSGGHVEPGEHPRTTVEREIIEELGISAEFVFPEPQFITATTTVGQTAGHIDVSLWYLVRGHRSQRLDFDRDEFTQVEWFSRNDVPYERVEPELGRFLAKLEGLVRKA
jgi:8-oxo-dGTP pyrophosphatase MutT (NUDIX family)